MFGGESSKQASGQGSPGQRLRAECPAGERSPDDLAFLVVFRYKKNYVSMKSVKSSKCSFLFLLKFWRIPSKPLTDEGAEGADDDVGFAMPDDDDGLGPPPFHD